jgi:hypothetical protein
VAEAGEHAALAHVARVKTLEPYVDLLREEEYEKLTEARDWSVASLSVRDPKALPEELEKVGEPLEDIRRALHDVPAEDPSAQLEQLIAEHWDRAVRWVALRGEIATVELRRNFAELEADLAQEQDEEALEADLEGTDLGWTQLEQMEFEPMDDGRVLQAVHLGEDLGVGV